jgi:DNA helicase-2/ATP-dependent DNA helicase PcrA
MGLRVSSSGAAATIARRRFEPSDQQAAFLSSLEFDDRNILLEARAGSGKSTTCREGAWSLGDRRSVYCCFNAHVARDSQADLPPSCRASTLHSLGFALVRDAYGAVDVDKDGVKVDRIAERYFPGRSGWAERRATARLVSHCKSRLIDGGDADELLSIAAEFDVEVPQRSADDVLATVPLVLRACLDEIGVVDFDDMVWMPVALGLKAAASPDVLFVDEAQDLNPCQHALVDVLCPDGRVVIVGDRWQSIYAFRGADSESIPRFQDRLAGSDRGLASLPLTVTRRCPARVVDAARRLVPDLDAMPDAPEGVVESVAPEKWAAHVRPGDMVLCRTVAPLVSACYQLLRADVRAVVRGRDIGKGLLTLIARMRAIDVGGLLRAVADHRVAECEKLSRLRNPCSALQSLNDRCDCLAAMCDGAKTVSEVKARIEAMFSDVTDSNVVTLSSIHRAKGLERERVMVLRPDLLPGPWARTDLERQQERNLCYVAVTRSAGRLTFAGDVPEMIADEDD